MSEEWLGEDFRCDWCDLHWPHHHGEAFAPNGDLVQVTFYYAKAPDAEVRDDETGEVIFPATKAPFKMIEGGKP